MKRLEEIPAESFFLPLHHLPGCRRQPYPTVLNNFALQWGILPTTSFTRGRFDKKLGRDLFGHYSSSYQPWCRLSSDSPSLCNFRLCSFLWNKGIQAINRYTFHALSGVNELDFYILHFRKEGKKLVNSWLTQNNRQCINLKIMYFLWGQNSLRPKRIMVQFWSKLVSHSCNSTSFSLVWSLLSVSL